MQHRKKHLRLRGENLCWLAPIVSPVETPPLARRKHEAYRTECNIERNTSACAEKTVVLGKSNPFSWKHLRLRGENYRDNQNNAGSIETPPLARRKLIYPKFNRFRVRNTSACAEKTGVNPSRVDKSQKHLRLRGENFGGSRRTRINSETPPLARRKPQLCGLLLINIGNTSACAEKTACDFSFQPEHEKHLRLRGENFNHFESTLIERETPPLARRKPFQPCDRHRP